MEVMGSSVTCKQMLWRQWFFCFSRRYTADVLCFIMEGCHYYEQNTKGELSGVFHIYQ